MIPLPRISEGSISMCIDFFIQVFIDSRMSFRSGMCPIYLKPMHGNLPAISGSPLRNWNSNCTPRSCLRMRSYFPNSSKVSEKGSPHVLSALLFCFLFPSCQNNKASKGKSQLNRAKSWNESGGGIRCCSVRCRA